MSCFILSDDRTADLARFISCALNTDFLGGYIESAALRQQLHACRDLYGDYMPQQISRVLRSANIAAYNHRYSVSAAADIPEHFPMGASIPAPVYGAGHVMIRAWHYQYLKLLHCYIYQIDEDAPENADLISALQIFAGSFESFICQNSEEYYAAAWA